MSDYVALHDQLDARVRASAAAIAPVVSAAVRPSCVLDVGCGNGTWLAAFAAAGAADILGLDGDYIDRTKLDIPADRFRPTDLGRPFALGRRFDLAVCLEVGEHLPEPAAEPLVAALVAHAPVVLFSAAVPGQGGVDHVHERWPSYWAGLFRAAGCVPVDLVRPRFWADDRVLHWYAQNALVYVKEEELPRYPELAAAVGGGLPLDVVHPRLHEALSREIGYARRPSVGSLLHALPAAGPSVPASVSPPEEPRAMIKIPALRFGKPYTSLDKATLVHHVTGEPVAEVSQVTGSQISRDISGVGRAKRELAAIPVRDLLAMYKQAADYFLNASLPCGDAELTFDEYVKNLSATTGSPMVFCRRNALKVQYVLDNVEEVIGGLTRGLPLEALDRGYSTAGGRMQAFYPTTDVLGAVLPSNSPGVHSLWVPTIALKTPLLLKPGREEPWTPMRVIQAFLKAGVPSNCLGFLPADHAGSTDILRLCGRSLAFGDDRSMAPYKNDHRVEIHGTGYSKFLFGADFAEKWEQYVDLLVEGIAANGGRACVNASAVWTPKNADAIATAVARKFVTMQPRAWDDPNCEISAFAKPEVAEAINTMIDEALKTPGARDVTQELRGSPRLVKDGRIAYLLPTVVRCDGPDHPLANKEFLFPYASVIECPQSDMLGRIGYTLAATALTEDPGFIADVLACPHIERLNLGPLPTNKLTWDQPHEGNLFTHLYKQRALQLAGGRPV